MNKAKHYINAIWFHFKIVWRVYEKEITVQGKENLLRMSWSTSWKISKGIYLTE